MFTKTTTKSIIFLAFLTFLSAIDEANDVKLAFEKHQVVPDVIDVAPPQLLHVTYTESGVSVNKGNVLTPTQVQLQPEVTWTPAPYAYYTIAFVDPDAPSRNNPLLREFKHWLVVNIPGNDVASGEVLAEYMGSAPPKGTGLHRYVFLLYLQPGKLQFYEQFVSDTSRVGRTNFKVNEFAAKYYLQNIAGNFFRAEYDSFVDILNQRVIG